MITSKKQLSILHLKNKKAKDFRLIANNYKELRTFEQILEGITVFSIIGFNNMGVTFPKTSDGIKKANRMAKKLQTLDFYAEVDVKTLSKALLEIQW